MEVLDLNEPLTPTLAFTVPVGAGGANSVAVSGDMVAVAVANDDKQAPGFVYFYDLTGTLVTTVTVGALPDMLTFTPDGQTVVVANEGEPDDDYLIDPEGTVSLIDVSGGLAALTQADVTSLGFTDFNVGAAREGELPTDVRIFGPGATVAQDLEPEYVTVSADSTTAWVTLQENNALAILDLTTPEVSAITALGFKDFNQFGNQLDPSDRDDGINLDNWPVYGMFQPDAIASFQSGGNTYLLTANEGDARDYDGFSEEVRIKDITLDTTVFSTTLQADELLGRLKITDQLGDADDNDQFEALYAYGARSFSIWDTAGNLVFDSGDEFEHLVAALYPTLFNANDSSPAEFDQRSDDKGNEPEGITQGIVNGRTYAFIGLERNGGIMVYDISDPIAPAFVQFLPPTYGNIAPEGLLFIPADESPTCYALLVVNYEDSGTTTIYQLGTGECQLYLPFISR
jgi:DNA-binding beta-propeller fold protein YncE